MQKKYRIEVTEEQLLLMIDCIEDCSRFMAGQTEMTYCVSRLNNNNEISNNLRKLQPLVTPNLVIGDNYGWNGGNCPNDLQRKFIAQTYYLYREMRHRFMVENGIENVYSSDTPRCSESGEPIKIELI